MVMAKQLTRILSIDGGGIRGIIPGEILVVLEQKLQTLSENPQARIADYFDLIAGTSTGGILSCIYLCPVQEARRPCFTAEQAVDLYVSRGGEIFDVPFFRRLWNAGGILEEKYPADGLEAALKDYFGDTKLSELLKPTLITAYDILRREGRFFTQLDAVNDDEQDFLVRDVCRATSAAPSFFEPALIESMAKTPYPLVDGAVFANNPAMCAYAEARNMPDRPRARDMAILSLGTGTAERAYSYEDAKGWGRAAWGIPMVDMMMSGGAETVDYQLRTIFDSVERKEQYLRLQVDMTRAPESAHAMDNASGENLDMLRELGREAARQNDRELAGFAELLVGGAPGAEPPVT
jgi:patatin-like phospholipase/acyl hydrolase